MLQLLRNFVLPPELRPWTLLGDFGPPDPLTNLFPLCPNLCGLTTPLVL